MMKLAEYLEKTIDQPFILDTIFKTHQQQFYNRF